MVERLVLAWAFFLALRMGGRERQMCRATCDTALLRGEWKALWGNAPMCLERWLVLSAPAFLIGNSNE